jgi:hypothetical protein
MIIDIELRTLVKTREISIAGYTYQPEVYDQLQIRKLDSSVGWGIWTEWEDVPRIIPLLGEIDGQG